MEAAEIRPSRLLQVPILRSYDLMIVFSSSNLNLFMKPHMLEYLDLSYNQL